MNNAPQVSERQQALGTVLQAAAQRPSPTNSPVLALVQGNVDKKEAGRHLVRVAQWVRWTARTLAPVALRKSPDLAARVTVSEAVSRTFGYGKEGAGACERLAGLLRELGATDSGAMQGPDLSSASFEVVLAWLLADRCWGASAGALAAALQHLPGISAQQVTPFVQHAELAVREREALLALAERTCDDGQWATLKTAAASAVEADPLSWLVCQLPSKGSR